MDHTHAQMVHYVIIIFSKPHGGKMATEAVPMQTATPENAAKSRRDKALEDYRKKLIEHKEQEDKLKKS